MASAIKMNRREILKLLPGIPLLSTGSGEQRNSFSTGVRHVLVEAHRGNSQYAPENTLAAIEQALTIGVDRIEIDLELSADRKLVVIHDNRVDRTTNGTGRVSELTFTQLRKLDAGSWKSDRYANERIPLLSEVLELCKGKTMVNIDLKNAGAALPMARMILEMGMENEVVITGKVPQCTAEIRSSGASLTMFYESGPLFRPLFEAENYEKAIQAAVKEAREYSLPGFLFHHKWISEEITHIAKLHGLSVGVYDVNDKATLSEMIHAGVDSVMTDDPARMKEWINES